MSVVLRTEGLRFERGGKEILRGVSIEASSGEVVGVLGPSGAGKSTLFRAITGEITLLAGAVSLGDQNVSQWPLWRRARAGVGYIPQEPSVFWDLTVRANLLAFQKIALGHATRAEEAAARVGLSERLDVRAGELSAGERRRLEFARAITRPPRVLICDEPFAGVDPTGAKRLGDLLGELGESGVTVLLADHHVAEALRICTRALLMLDGAIAASATPSEFQEHPLVRGRYLGSWARTLPPPPPA